jgi:hypothetical protein
MAITDYQTQATEMVATMRLLFQAGVMSHSGNAYVSARIPGRDVQLVLSPRSLLPMAHAGNQASLQSSEPAREVTWYRIQWWICIPEAQISLVASTLSIMWRRQQVWLHQHGAAIVSGLVFFTIICCGHASQSCRLQIRGTGKRNTTCSTLGYWRCRRQY